jgi:hypothetical protein
VKPTDKKFPHANVAGQQPRRPTPHAQQFKPAVAQSKNAVAQPKSALPAHASRHPVAPPVYRPQATPPVAQRKAAAAPSPKASPIVPPAYRPQPAPKVLQTKRAVAAPARPSRPEHKPPTPFGHRPPPGVLQAKQTNEPRAPLAKRSGGQGSTPAPCPRQPVSQSRLGTRPQGFSGSRTIQRLVVDAINPHLDGLAGLFAEPAAAAAPPPPPPPDPVQDKKDFYSKGANAAHLFIQGMTAARVGAMRLNPKLFRAYDYFHAATNSWGYGGEYMFKEWHQGRGRGSLLAQCVVHVHWDEKGVRQVGRFKDHATKLDQVPGLPVIEATRLTAIGVPASETLIKIAEKKEG